MKYLDDFYSDALFRSNSSICSWALVFIVLLPLAMTLPVFAMLAADYAVHAGTMALVAQSIREGAYFPAMTNSVQLIGDPVISLSGRLYYLAGGYLSVIFGTPHIAIRIMLSAVVIVSTVAVFRCALRFSGRIGFSLAIAAMSSWTTYSMNNLYVRGAIAEFIATNLLVASVALLLIWWHPKTDGRLRSGLGMIVCYTFAALTHPITAVYGALTIAIVAAALAAAFGWRKVRWLEGTAYVGLVVIILAPWLATLLEFPPTQSAISYSFLLYRYPGLDEALLRLLPLPISMMPREYGYRVFVTQINTPMLICAAWLIGRIVFFNPNRKEALVGVALLAVAAMFFIISVSPVFDSFLPTPLLAAQFGYRLVTYTNIFLLMSAVVSSSVSEALSEGTYSKAVWSSALAFALIGVLWNIIAMSHGIGYSGYPFLKAFPSASQAYSFHYSAGCQYATGGKVDDPVGCNTKDVNLFMPPALGASTPVHVNPGAYITNVVYFPWNELLLDGSPLKVFPFKWFTGAVIETPGMLSYRSNIPKLFQIADKAAVILFLIISAIWGGSAFFVRLNTKIEREPQ